MSGANKNMFRGISGIFALMIIADIVLNRTAYYLGAGTEAFNLSLLFTAAQTLVISMAYIFWYRKVSYNAADMISIADMRKMAFHYKNRYLITSVLVTGGIAFLAVICMVLNILFVGIISLYCYISVLTMFFLGNVALFLLMRFWGLPNRITGSY